MRERDRSRERERERKSDQSISMLRNHDHCAETTLLSKEDINKLDTEHTVALKLMEKEEAPPHPDDLRSTKKVKILADKDFNNQHSPEAHMEDAPAVESNSSKTEVVGALTEHPSNMVSFRDKLLNNTQTTEEEDDIQLNEEDVTFGKDGLFPSVTFSPRIHKILEESMKHSVVLKLLGQPIGYAKLKLHLLRLWKFVKSFRLSDLEGGCFIASFKNASDYHKVLTEGPWMIAGHYLTVHPWTPEFSPMNHSVSQVVAWIRILGLPTKYYKKNIIRAIGEVLGKVIRIDYNTESGERGKFARMAVIVDLSAPLTSKITVDGIALLIEYKGLPTICYHCGHYGHFVEMCPLKRAETLEESNTGATTNSSPKPPAKGPSASEVTESNPYGDWMVAPPRSRRFPRDLRKFPESSHHLGLNLGSRYDILRTSNTPPDNIHAPTPQNTIVNPQPSPSPQNVHSQPAKSMKTSKAQSSKPSATAKSQKKPNSNTNTETIFSSNAYLAPHLQQTTLDQTHHTTISLPNPKGNLKPTNSSKPTQPSQPTYKDTQQNQNNKENL